MDEGSINEVHVIDTLNILTEDGFRNLCNFYGKIKNIIVFKKVNSNCAFIEFENEQSANAMINGNDDLPSFISVSFSKRMIKRTYLAVEKDIPVIEIEKPKDDVIIPLKSYYFGPLVSGNALTEESKQYKLMNTNVKSYNLGNDDLFGKPLNTKWEKSEKLVLTLHDLDFNYRFENCSWGKIKIEKKLSPNSCTGWTTFFYDGENVQNILKSFSNDIECSNLLNINSLKCGMLVGAYDRTTNLYGRGYVMVIAGNSANVVMSDFGKVINTNEIRELPETFIRIPMYAFKVYTKGNDVAQLEEKFYIFNVHKVSAEQIILDIIHNNKKIKIQLEKWKPTVEEYGVPYIEFKNGSLVELLELKDMNLLYLRTKHKDYHELMFKCWESVSNYCYRNSQPLSREPLYGEIVGFKSKITTNYVRGRIHKFLGDNNYSVKHMDDPLKEIIKSSEMIELQFEHKNLPVSYIKVGLEKALPYFVQHDARDFVNLIIEKQFVIVAHFDETNENGWTHVNLVMKKYKEDLNAILFGLTEPSWLKDKSSAPIEDPMPICTYEYISKNKLKEKSVVKMKFVMYHEGIFYMRDKLFGKYFSLLSKMIKEYCGVNLHSYLPHNDEVCLGQFPDGMWYRVVCDTLKPGELTKVHSIDLGNVAFLNCHNIRKIPLELLFEPSHVYLCFLDTSIKIDKDKVKLLKEYENTDCEITIVEDLFEKNHYLIKCPFIEDLLKQT
ncbi:Tudor domain,RNA recognition motif domain [Cinara cedri]|uniref:Tudor domain,RNA recognition motif domain n=1 Tax=Cinara cedri TaxID=506608 RepID=A0A5E4MTM1_9HEMI|nr:Tudor domain,RNA recognition motif domain [Cinara cedri]